ncbi:MAG: polyprenyl synthetase family protein [Spirochaetales bacterium]|nr:polyprenyl synthetase family protein [Spirochaetales bacterium]
MNTYFAKQKKAILGALNQFFTEMGGSVDPIGIHGKDFFERILAFMDGGKVLRGGLSVLAYDLFGEGDRAQAIRLGAAMELFQAAFLVHDDIMDRDITRRGMSSLHHQYTILAEKQGFPDPHHTGESLGICAGDIAIFLAFHLLNTLEGPLEDIRRINSLCSKELALVAVAQMRDVYQGAPSITVTEDDILNLYLYKTARYTFTVPLLSGAFLAGADEKSLNALEDFGNNLGTVFQLKDDELGLFGDENSLGKPIGSDIREGKKTLYYVLLYKRAGADERKHLSTIFGNKQIGQEEIDWIRNLVFDHGIQDHVSAIISEYTRRAGNAVEKIPLKGTDEFKILGQLLDYSGKRQK